jgi:ketosteroid isomerase-like protein
MSGYSPDVLVFDVVDPLRKFGAAALRKRVEEWFSAFQGPIDYEMRNLEIACAGELAFCYSVNHIRGAKIDGGEINMWIRATVCFRKIDGEWTVVHEHVSVPFDPETGLASMDLEP